jgi:large subunit ribosomal protein L22
MSQFTKKEMSGYTKISDFETTARAIGKELSISPRHAVEVCREIKGMPLDKAVEFLEDVIELKKAVPFKRHVGGLPHKRGKGMATGRYPQKAARAIKDVLEQARNNAEFKEITGSLRIVHAAAHRGRPWHSWFQRAHGNSTPKTRETVNVEVIVEEYEE